MFTGLSFIKQHATMSLPLRWSRAIYFLFICTLPANGLFSQTLLQEDFTNYNGTASTLPTDWYFSSHGSYSSTVFSGTSGPNSYKFSVDGATIISPEFHNADSLYFWIKGAGIDSLSNLNVLESTDTITWTSIANINAINKTSASGKKWGFALQSNTKHVKFSYEKSTGNLAFDDFKVIRSQNQNSYIHPADTAIAEGKIKIYFNHPVDTTVSSGVNALNIGNKMLDTLAAYINRAKYSVDISMYNYLHTNMEKIADAVNNAYSRGVEIRWIYNESASNTGLTYLNSNIATLGRSLPSGLMHNKFVIIDAKSPINKDAIVHTGSTNWGWHQIDNDFNNLVVFQDSLFADAYTKEFNQMWGGSDLLPDLTRSKFGANKASVLTNHTFNIGEVPVDLYFSPADPTNQMIINSINSAESDLYFGVFSFTLDQIANAIKNRIQDDVFTAGIMGAGSLPHSAYAILEPLMGNNLQIDGGGEVYHSKIGIIDHSNPSSDPQVITGAHNWSVSANTKNDENTVIIHSAVAANMFYQSFHRDFNSLGGTLGQREHNKDNLKVNVYPTPFSKVSTLEFTLKTPTQLTIKAYNLNGKEQVVLTNEERFDKGMHSIQFAPESNGVYVILIQNGTQTYVYKTIKTEN